MKINYSYRYILLFWIIILLQTACTQNRKPDTALGNNDIEKVMQRVTSVMVHDVTNPPLAARFFAYINLAGYQAISNKNDQLPSLSSHLQNFQWKEITPVSTEPELGALMAMIRTAQKIQPSGFMITEFEKQFLDSCRQLGYQDEVLERATRYGQQISEQVLSYAAQDGYQMTVNYPKYTPTEEEGKWYPTPPAYFAAVEPYFNTIRSFTLDSAGQFKPARPVSYDPDSTSQYFKLLKEVYEEQIQLPDDHRKIASFWDCNPFAMEDNGHLMIGLKKISPGAHWMGITSIACRKASLNFGESMKVHTTLAIGMMDAFLSCWDEKYRSNRIRPETAIRKLIDPTWEPLLQTPPFPEYPSGHSTVSAACAVILTHFFGDHFEFTDNVEVSYGIPERHFDSFMQAAKEAATSRLYGGIHYRDANENGTDQGVKIGHWVLQKLPFQETATLANNEK